MKNKKYVWCLLLLFLVHLFTAAYPYLPWQHKQSTNFVLSYTDATAVYSEETLQIAENTLAVLADYFGYTPGRKVSIILTDTSDASDGSASADTYVVTIICRNTGLEYRLIKNWIANVLSHELAHIYSLTYFRNPFYLYLGFSLDSYATNTLLDINTTLRRVDIPFWFREGAAQTGSWLFNSDTRDPYREMLLRDDYRHHSLLTLEEMRGLFIYPADGERGYNQGFDFVLFLKKTYPGITLKTLCRNAVRMGFAEAVKTTYNTSLDALYRQWLAALAIRFPEAQETTAGEKLFNKPGLNVKEWTCAQNAQYVLASWGSEYKQMKIFGQQQDGTYKVLVNETGSTLKQDPVTGTVWFNKLVYNQKTDRYNFDIFLLDKYNQAQQITRQSRAIAFDVQDDHLYYARYDDGRHELLHRNPAGNEASLYHFPAGKTIYSLSVIGEDRLLLEIGEETGVTLYDRGIFTKLWEGQNIINPVYAGRNRVVFTSTQDGTPQIYWADLNSPELWYQITQVPGGAFNPVYEKQDKSEVLYFSVFENSSFMLYKRENPFQTGAVYNTLTLEPAWMPEPPGSLAPILTKAVSNLTTQPLYYFTGVTLSGLLTDPQALKSLDLTSSIQGELFSAPGDFSLFYSCSLLLPSRFTSAAFTMNPARLAAATWSRWKAGYAEWYLDAYFDLSYDLVENTLTDTLMDFLTSQVSFKLIPGILHNFLNYRITFYNYMNPLWSDILFHAWTLSNSLIINPDLNFFADYILNWRQAIIDFGMGTYMLEHIAKAGFSFKPYADSIVDVARLGQSAFTLDGNITGNWDLRPDSASNTMLVYPYYAVNLNTSSNWLLPGRKMALSLGMKGFTYLFEEENTYYAYYDLPTTSQLSAAYAAANFRIKDLAVLQAGVKINPFVNVEKPTYWYELMHISALFTGGIARYYADSFDIYGFNPLTVDYPVILDAALNWYIYINPPSYGTFSVSFSTALYQASGAPLPPPSLTIAFTL